MSYDHEKNPMTLEQFRATKVAGLKDAVWCHNNGLAEDYVNAAEYAGATYILIDDENSFSLYIGNQSWASSNLAELEKILYDEWYLPEIAGIERPPTCASSQATSIDSAELRRRLFGWAGATPGQASEDEYRELVKFIDDAQRSSGTPSITLNARQLRTAAELAFPDGDGHPAQFETVVTICHREAFRATSDENSGESVDCPAGIYIYFNDMPDQGLQYLNPDIGDHISADSSAS